MIHILISILFAVSIHAENVADSTASKSETSVSNPRLKQDVIDALIKRKFPFKNSNTNCHATSMAVTGVLSVLVSQDNRDVFIRTSCFKPIQGNPQPGDVGFYQEGEPEKREKEWAFHSVTFIKDGTYFHKANPGADQHPFEMIEPEKVKMDRTQLTWARYNPSDKCHLTRFQNWLDQNRQNGKYSKLVQKMEAWLLGKPGPSVGYSEYFAIAKAYPDPGIKDEDLNRQIKMLTREFLNLPEHAQHRRAVEVAMRPEMSQALRELQEYMKDPAVVLPDQNARVIREIVMSSRASYKIDSSFEGLNEGTLSQRSSKVPELNWPRPSKASDQPPRSGYTLKRVDDYMSVSYDSHWGFQTTAPSGRKWKWRYGSSRPGVDFKVPN